jgi:ABC-type transport system involved in cytochrome c biogenesis permease subunit
VTSWLVSETWWVRAGILLLAVNAVFVLFGKRARSRQDRVTDRLLAIAVVAIGIGIGLRWQQSGQGPFLTLYEILVSNVFSLGLFVLLALPPTFDNPWLWVHVLAGKLFLGAALVATGLSVRLLLRAGRNAGAASAQNADNLDVRVWRFAALAFLFDSAMLVAGAAWARDAWGRYWAWDPLETWALLTWLALALVLHARVGLNLPRWSGWVGMCLVFVLAFLTFFGVPFLSMAAHKGVM